MTPVLRGNDHLWSGFYGRTNMCVLDRPSFFKGAFLGPFEA